MKALTFLMAALSLALLFSTPAGAADTLLAAHEGGRGGPPPGKGTSSGTDHHDDHDDSHETDHDEGHDDGHSSDGHDDEKRGPRYKGGRSVADLKSGFGHSFDAESVIFRH
jgi:hypothetical protein